MNDDFIVENLNEYWSRWHYFFIYVCDLLGYEEVKHTVYS